MLKYYYFERPYNPNKEFVEQLNDECSKIPGRRFICQTQSVSPVKDLRTGLPKIEVKMLYEQSIFTYDKDGNEKFFTEKP